MPTVFFVERNLFLDLVERLMRARSLHKVEKYYMSIIESVDNLALHHYHLPSLIFFAGG